MTSHIYMHGLMGELVVAELPVVVTERADEARLEGDAWITLNSQGSYAELKEVDRQDGTIVMEAEQRDSFTDIRIRHEAILAVRESHPGEVPE